MTDLTALPALLARVEDAAGGDRGLDREILEAVGGAVDGQYWRWPGEENSSSFGVTPPFTTSLDATVALVETLRPGWWWEVSLGVETYSEGPFWASVYNDATLNIDGSPDPYGGKNAPLALLAALLRSMIEEEGE